MLLRGFTALGEWRSALRVVVSSSVFAVMRYDRACDWCDLVVRVEMNCVAEISCFICLRVPLGYFSRLNIVD